MRVSVKILQRKLSSAGITPAYSSPDLDTSAAGNKLNCAAPQGSAYGPLLQRYIKSRVDQSSFRSIPVNSLRMRDGPSTGHSPRSGAGPIIRKGAVAWPADSSRLIGTAVFCFSRIPTGGLSRSRSRYFADLVSPKRYKNRTLTHRRRPRLTGRRGIRIIRAVPRSNKSNLNSRLICSVTQ
jgi:hypothetical protein